MSTNEKNRFSTLLEELISISGVKNSGLAKALQYDASYISKWVSGRLLPTEKTKKKILSGLSHEIVNQSTSEGLENLYANYQVSFPEELENVIYDSIFIMNMLSAMSQVDFYLYQNQQASGRMIFTVKNDFMISALLVNPDRCMSVTISSNEKNCNPIYHGIKDRCTRESLLCRRTSMKEMLSSHDYMHSILSLHSKWGIGHMTEHFLPDDLFHEILDLLKSSNDELFFDEDHLCYLHSMTQRTLAESEIDLFIHCQALSDLVVDGNLDFYDQKVHLTLSQRKKYFNHLLHVFETNSNLTFKLAKEPMILDFKYQTNQCIFLSDQFSYIRLNTYNWANNLAIINHPNLKHMFDRFFNAVWNDATSELLSDYSEIHSFFVHIIQQINILSEI